MKRIRYRTLSSYWKKTFGQPVRKISLQAGFSCPNRDGLLSHAGCSYCEPETFSPFAGHKTPPLTEQLQQGIKIGRDRGVHRFVAYFQAYSNTYAPLAVLKDTYAVVKNFPEIVGIAIGTRPDCIDEEKLDLISSFSKNYEVWLEYGLQSIHNATLLRINRGHTAGDFMRAVQLTRRYAGIKICAHVILGLPGEDREMELKTAGAIARLKLEGVKLHPLHVIADTLLAKEYAQGEYQVLSLDEYVTRAVRFIEQLWPQTVIQRLSADSRSAKLVAPEWLQDKAKVLASIQKRMEEEDTWQGKAMHQSGILEQHT